MIRYALKECVVKILDEIGIDMKIGIRDTEGNCGHYFSYGYIANDIKIISKIEDMLSLKETEINNDYESWRKYSPDTNEGDEVDDWLGSYKPMKSPGLITLNSKNLSKLVLKVLFEIRNVKNGKVNLSNRKNYTSNIDIAQVVSIAMVLTLKTIYHEYFHYFCDISRKCYGAISAYSQDEEALAVAYSYKMLFTEMLLIMGHGHGQPISGTGPFSDEYQQNIHKLIVEARILSGKDEIWENFWLHRVHEARNDKNKSYMIDEVEEIICNTIFNYTANGYKDYNKYIEDFKFYEGISSYIFSKKLSNHSAPFNGYLIIDSQLRTILNHMIMINIV